MTTTEIIERGIVRRLLARQHFTRSVSPASGAITTLACVAGLLVSMLCFGELLWAAAAVGLLLSLGVP